MSNETVPAHDQKVTNHYIIHYPDHEPRESDPHYKDFHAYRRQHVDTAICEFAVHRDGDTSECHGGLELHHSIIELALMNAVDLALLEADYPGISDPETLGDWINSAANLVFYCAKHHRGNGGIHHASASDWGSQFYIRNMIS